MGLTRELERPVVRQATLDGTEPMSFDITAMDPREVRLLRDRKRQKMTGLRARLNLLVSNAVQFELNRIGGSDGVEVIASAAGVPPPQVWKILAGEYSTSKTWWNRLERVLMLCHPSQAPERVMEAQDLFRQVAHLAKEVEVLNNKAVEHMRQRRAADLYPTSPAGLTGPAGRGTGGPPESDTGEYELPLRGLDGTSPPSESQARPDGEPDPQPSPRTLASPAIPDVQGHDQRPDPLKATTPAEFVETMRAYRIWAGNPSLRTMQDRCAKQISYSTFRNMLTSPTVPTQLASIETFVHVLGGTAEDVQRWATAWRHFAMNQDQLPPEDDPHDGHDTAPSGPISEEG